MRRVVFALVVSLALVAPASASQIVSLGAVTPDTFTATDNGDGTTTLSTTSTVSITNIIQGPLDPTALFTFTATSTDDAQLLLGGTVIAQRFAGSFDLTNAAGTFSYLSGTFGAALEFGGNGSTGSLLTANSFPQSPPLVLDTDLLLAQALSDPQSFGLTFSNIVVPLHVNTYLVNGVSHTTTASFTATYVASADATLTAVAVPEPATLLLLGSGLLGGAPYLRARLRRSD